MKKTKINPWDTKRKRTRFIKKCLHCGKDFFVIGAYKNVSNRGKFCSRDCYLKEKNKNASRHACIVCGKKFIMSEKRSSKRFCSLSCMAEYLKTKWNRAKEACLFRDNYTCQICGIKKGQIRNGKRVKVEVHHLDGTGSNIPAKEMNNNLDNLITVCHQCHIKEELKLKGIDSFSCGEHKLKKERNEKIYELFRYKSMSQAKISKMFRLTRQRVNQIINSML